VVERLAQQMVRLQAQEQRLQQPLYEAHGEQRAAHVFEQQKVSARAQHPSGLGDGPAVVRDRAEGESADHGVEGPIGEVQVLGIADAQVGVPAQVVRPPPGKVEHGGAQLDAREPHLRRVEWQVAAGTDRQFQRVAARLFADPLPAVAEEVLLAEAHARIVPGRLPIVVAPDALRLVWQRHRPPPGTRGIGMAGSR
jgi:hypothetical protein